MIGPGEPFFDLTERVGVYVVNTDNNMSSFADNIDGSKTFTQQAIEKIKQQGETMTEAQLSEFGLLFDNSNLL